MFHRAGCVVCYGGQRVFFKIGETQGPVQAQRERRRPEHHPGIQQEEDGGEKGMAERMDGGEEEEEGAGHAVGLSVQEKGCRHLPRLCQQGAGVVQQYGQ